MITEDDMKELQSRVEQIVPDGTYVTCQLSYGKIGVIIKVPDGKLILTEFLFGHGEIPDDEYLKYGIDGAIIRSMQPDFRKQGNDPR